MLARAKFTQGDLAVRVIRLCGSGEAPVQRHWRPTRVGFRQETRFASKDDLHRRERRRSARKCLPTNRSSKCTWRLICFRIRRIHSTLTTRSMAGVTVPDTLLVSEAISYAREHTEPFVYNHVMLSWLFAAALAEATRLRTTPKFWPSQPSFTTWDWRKPFRVRCASKSRGPTRPGIRARRGASRPPTLWSVSFGSMKGHVELT